MEQHELLPKLFRSEYRKIVSVLCRLFGISHIEIAEDIVSDTFLAATESWAIKGIPDNPTAWLYTVAKNKTKNHFRRSSIYEQKVSPEITRSQNTSEEIDIDLSEKNITDSQLAMMFAVCNPVNGNEAQIALALNLLCGFGAGEIADAFLTNRELIYKRISRAKEKLKEYNISIAYPTDAEVHDRLENVLKTIYLLFSEGYYSTSQNVILRQDLCAEALRLCYLLIQNKPTDLPAVNALMALMVFHSSRFEARTGDNGEIILYQDQDRSLWNRELIDTGTVFLKKSAEGNELSRYHIEAAIAYWHTQADDDSKWRNILDLYNQLLVLDYSPIADLNCIYALSKVDGKEKAIERAEKLALANNHFYHSLLGNLYTGFDNKKALIHFQTALDMARTDAEKQLMSKNIQAIKAQ